MTRLPPLRVELPATIIVAFSGRGVPRVRVKTELLLPAAFKRTEGRLNEEVQPVKGRVFRLTVPEKPGRAERVIVDEGVSPQLCRKIALGLGERVKPSTFTIALKLTSG